jgi:hypothetical protein
MITDVVIIETGFKQFNQFNVTMPEVEYTAVAVKIEQAFGAVDVPHERSFTRAHNKVHTVSVKKGHLAR